MTEFVYRTERHIDRDGKRWVIVWRRDVIRDGDPVHLGGCDRVTVPEGKQTSPAWEAATGLLSLPCKISRERFKACGYSVKAPVEIQP